MAHALMNQPERSLIASFVSRESWARTTDRAARTVRADPANCPYASISTFSAVRETED
jgi:hypothetical protein